MLEHAQCSKAPMILRISNCADLATKTTWGTRARLRDSITTLLIEIEPVVVEIWPAEVLPLDDAHFDRFHTAAN